MKEVRLSREARNEFKFASDACGVAVLLRFAVLTRAVICASVCATAVHVADVPCEICEFVLAVGMTSELQSTV